MESFTDFVAKKEKDPKRSIVEGIDDNDWQKLVDIVTKVKPDNFVSVSNGTLTSPIKVSKDAMFSSEGLVFNGEGTSLLQRNRIQKIEFDDSSISIKTEDGWFIIRYKQ